jgi:hypothetical protein
MNFDALYLLDFVIVAVRGNNHRLHPHIGKRLGKVVGANSPTPRRRIKMLMKDQYFHGCKEMHLTAETQRREESAKKM